MIDENKKRKIELNLDYKIKKIDNLLNGSANLEFYVESIENSNISVPSDMEEKILERLNIDKNNNIKKKNIISLKEETSKRKSISKEENDKVKSNKYFDILKIAACTVFALVIWEFIFSKQPTYATDKNIKPDSNTVKMYEKIETVTDKISEFMMKPVSFERRDK